MNLDDFPPRHRRRSYGRQAGREPDHAGRPRADQRVHQRTRGRHRLVLRGVVVQRRRASACSRHLIVGRVHVADPLTHIGIIETSD
jgi:hypothetical protein